ncbi:MAG: sigma-54-dependent Fis family transcriptional regulator [Candidatus Tectomicrobia bacterium]|nr:sigma-54-dependent Fis family transcriptional regulator [Candidatus Tectomicrobia bacterium]
MANVVPFENVLQRRQRHDAPPVQMIGSSPAMQELWRLLPKLAPKDVTVLIQGESGTGKELVAQILHSLSERREGPFVTLNCGALQETVMESELFGHERGSFTGAVASTQGLFEAADRGSLFLDEVGELTPPMQVKLLRVLQSGEIRRLGSTKTRHVNVRVIAATNKDLTAEVEAGRFREDLYYRLNVVALQVPALRQRLSDIPVLVEHFLLARGELGRPPLKLSPEALHTLQHYHWPGNVRELQNLLEHLRVVTEHGRVGLHELPPHIRFASLSMRRVDEETLPLAEVERRHILRVLKHQNGNKTRTAKILGIGLKTLYNKLKCYDLQA